MASVVKNLVIEYKHPRVGIVLQHLHPNRIRMLLLTHIPPFL